MKKSIESNGLSKWLKDNAWNLIITGWMVGAGILFLQFRVSGLEKAQAQFEKKLGDYPSVDYFNEKFKNIDDKQNTMATDMKDLKKDLQNHISQK
jgi:hypothetical protein